MSIVDYVSRIVATLGDVNPIEYGGGFAYTRNDSNPPELEWIEPPPDDRHWECKVCSGMEGGTCGDVRFYSGVPHHWETLDCEHDACDGNGAWVCAHCRGTGEEPGLRWTVYTVLLEPHEWVEWEDVARLHDVPLSEYRAAFERKDAAAMAHSLVDAAGYHGWHEFDSDPLSLTRAEVEARVNSLAAIGKLCQLHDDCRACPELGQACADERRPLCG